MKKDIKLEKLIKTTSNWCGNFEGDKVEISLLNIKSYDKQEYNYIQIKACGNDDFELEMYFEGTETENNKKFKEYKMIYDNIPEPCSIEYFINLGFYST